MKPTCDADVCLIMPAKKPTGVMAIIRAIVGGLEQSGSEAAVRSECDKQSDGEHPTCSVILGRRFVLMVRGRARMHCGRSSSPHPHTNRCQLELVPVPFDFGRVLGVVLPDQWQSALTQYAFKHARRDPRMRGSWEFANPSFLVSWGQQHQPPHLDLLRPLFQFTLGMMLEVPHYPPPHHPTSPANTRHLTNSRPSHGLSATDRCRQWQTFWSCGQARWPKLGSWGVVRCPQPRRSPKKY
jgi:hypothetical protein